MENFRVALDAIIPFLLYLAFGYFSRRGGAFDEEFATRFNRVVFKLFFPFLTFYNIYSANMSAMPSAKLLATVLISLPLLILFLCWVVPRFVPSRPRAGVVVQGIYRSNVLLYGLPLTINLFGQESAPMAAVIVTICITIYNITAVLVLEWFGGEAHSDPKKLLLSCCRNPLLQGAAVGILFFALGIHIPAPVEKFVAAFSNMTTPLALFILGSTLHFPAIKKNAKYIIGVLGIKMMVLPAIVLPLGLLLGLDGLELFLLVMIYATPIATASYPMAQNMGCDGELAGQLVMLSTVVSLGTLFFWIFLMKSLMLF